MRAGRLFWFALTVLLGAPLLARPQTSEDEPSAPSPSLDDERERDLLDQAWGEPETGRPLSLRGWASVALFGGRARGGDATLVSPSFGLRLAFTEELDVSASWALAYGLA